VAVALGLVCGLILPLLPGVADAKGKGKKVGHQLTVMTRNVYLGADLSPALRASTVDDAINAGGQIVNQVHATKFPSVRAAQLAAEIKKQRPDVVGIQEGAWWRTATPASLTPALTGHPSASQADPLGGDFLTDLLTELNKGGRAKNGKKSSASTATKGGTLRYRLAVAKTEFDFELPANNGSGGLAAADHNERLTMRDAILVRQGGGIKASHPSSGTFNTLLQVKLANALPVNVTRGWAAIDIRAHGRTFRVVDTHLEAFDGQASNNANDGKSYPKGAIRQAQAQQLVAPGGPTSTRLPTILLGDLNSDDPVHGDQVSPGDALAFQAVLGAGFRERSLAVPPSFGCCIQDPNLADPSTAGITHRVDHIMSNSKKVVFKTGALTHTYSQGLWSSDHYGLASTLLIR
jgi:endonuclease/exonuclease/phosphatase family metal-dependent hydrolase